MKMKPFYLLTLTSICLLYLEDLTAQTIWTGPDVTFAKAANADWALEANQDRITNDVWITRQDRGPIYNFKWWQDTFGTDATFGDLSFNFWNNEFGGPVNQIFTATGGPKGVRWCIIDDTGATVDWSGFSFYGKLGDPTHFYSFHNIASMIKDLEASMPVTSVDDDFNLNGFLGGSSASMPLLVGKKLGVWIVADDIYLELTFNNWGSGGNGGGAFSYTPSSNQTLSINAFELDKQVALHPNPSNEFIQIYNLKSKEPYCIYNVLGAEIKNGLVSNNERIGIRDLSNGIYILKFNNGETIKFIKK